MRAIKKEKDPKELSKKPLANRDEREMLLQLAAAQQLNRFINPMTKQKMRETDPLAADYIDNELLRIPDNPYYTSQRTGEGTSWSGVTVSDLAKAFDPEFQGSAGHWSFIGDAFRGESNYTPTKINDRSTYNVGDIVFRPRGGVSDKSYAWMKRQGLQNKSYPGHSDIIVGVKTGPNGETIYQLQGGNMGDTLYTRDMTASEIADAYRGALTQNNITNEPITSTGLKKWQ